ncbi:MAG: helix-turn-helix transcriptional regulator [Succinivibrio sp.]|jgi:transcriptional regulator with XRE-family HTH domain|nr:helix-turn-helix transcriptional regulator [Succinivibrio sp.]
MASNTGKVILEQLKKLSMSQKELAEATGLTESAVSRYVKGERVPRGINLMKIANSLSITVDQLLADDNTKDDINVVKNLIARNASKMSDKDRLELINLLTNIRED